MNENTYFLSLVDGDFLLKHSKKSGINIESTLYTTKCNLPDEYIKKNEHLVRDNLLQPKYKLWEYIEKINLKNTDFSIHDIQVYPLELLPQCIGIKERPIDGVIEFVYYNIDFIRRFYKRAVKSQYEVHSNKYTLKFAYQVTDDNITNYIKECSDKAILILLKYLKLTQQALTWYPNPDEAKLYEDERDRLKEDYQITVNNLFNSTDYLGDLMNLEISIFNSQKVQPILLLCKSLIDENLNLDSQKMDFLVNSILNSISRDAY